MGNAERKTDIEQKMKFIRGTEQNQGVFNSGINVYYM